MISATSLSTQAVETPKPHILVVDDEKIVRQLCRDIAEASGMTVETASTTEGAIDVLENQRFDVVVTDILIPEIGGMELIKRIRATQPDVGIIVVTGHGTIEMAVEAIYSGVIDYITKPFSVEAFEDKLKNVVQVVKCNRNRQSRRGVAATPSTKLIGQTTRMNQVQRLIQTISCGNYPVLILGETGTGKEVVARAIHFSGPRAKCPFVPVDCAALTPTLVESELFGHEKGAFTGASYMKPGLFEAAHTGTLFLDEIGELPKDLQSKLLRVLQQREVRRVGSNVPMAVNVRIIAATNRDLKKEVAAGNFREDLFYRLNVVNLDLPPLRERTADLPLLVSAFLEKFSSEWRQITCISPGVWPKLSCHHWPGNVRELENVIESAVALGTGSTLHENEVVINSRESLSVLTDLPAPDVLCLESMERRTILCALRETRGDKLRAAHLLGIGKTTLYRKLKQYKLERLSLPLA
jgi:DNA-binding NtrC family response regulator